MKNKRIYTSMTIALILAIAAATLGVTQTALAASGGGTGTLTASGDGLAGIRGSATVTITGNGILWIRDLGGDASIQVSGYGTKTELPNGWIRYFGFQGNAIVTGSSITVALSGYDIHLQATGTGKYVLRGNGSYTAERNGTVISGAWSDSAEDNILK